MTENKYLKLFAVGLFTLAQVTGLRAQPLSFGDTSPDIEAGSVTTAKLANGSVTTPKLHVDALYPFYPNGTTADFIGSVKSLGSFRLSQTWNLITEDGVDLAIHGDNAIKFKTSNTIDRMIIEAGGNVGIGTASPEETLDVVGTVKVNKADGNIAQDLYNVTGNTPQFIGIGLGSSDIQYVGVSNGADSNGTGLFGFKTRAPTPAADADTIVADGDDILTINAYGADGADYQQAAYMWMEVDGSPGLGDMPGRIVFGTTDDGASSSTERMRIASNGNVGIGVTDPGAQTQGTFSGMEIAADATNGEVTALFLKNLDSTSGTDGATCLEFGVKATDRPGGKICAGRDDTYDSAASADSHLRFSVALDNSFSEAMRIDRNGNVGIGTASPGATLDVNGDARISTSLRISSGPTAGIDILGITGGSTNNDWGATAAQSCDVFVMTIAGVGTNGRWQCNVSASQTTVEDSTCFLRARPSAENTVQVKRCNVGSVSCSDPANATHYINCLNF